MLKLGVVAIVIGGLLLAGCSSSGFTGAQQKFLSYVRAGGISSADMPDQGAIEAGNAVCNDLSRGMNPDEVGDALDAKRNDYGPHVPFTFEAYFQVVAVETLCPQFLGQYPKGN